MFMMKIGKAIFLMHQLHVRQSALNRRETDRLLACSQLQLFSVMRQMAFGRFCDHQIFGNVIVFAKSNPTQCSGLFSGQYSVLNLIYNNAFNFETRKNFQSIYTMPKRNLY